MFNFRIAITPSGVPHIGNFFVIFINYILKTKLLGNIILRFDDTNQFKNKNINKFFIIKNLKKNGFFFKKITKQTLNLNLYYKKNIFKKKIMFKKTFFNIKLSKFNNCYSIFIFINFIKINYFDNNYGIKKNNLINEKQIIIKKTGIPTYNFSSIIDDINNNIFIILRGKEWLNQLKFHIYILNIFKQKIIFHHIPNVNVNNKKLSKRNKSINLNFLKLYNFFFSKKKNIININYLNIFKIKEDIKLTNLLKKIKIIKKNNFIMNIIHMLGHIDKNFINNLLNIKNNLLNKFIDSNLSISNLNFIEKNLFDINSIVSNLKIIKIKNLFNNL